MNFSKNKISIDYLLIFFTALSSVSSVSFAQNLDSIKVLWNRNELARAKESIDRFVIDSNLNAEVWLLRANIYNDIARHSEYNSLVADGRSEAFRSINNALHYNETYTRSVLQKTDFHLLSEIIDGYGKEGIAYFNAGIENQQFNNYQKSFELFKKAETAGNLLADLKNNSRIPDNSYLYFITISAIFAQKDDEAEYYSRKFIETDISKDANQNNAELIYQWLVYFYRKRNNTTELTTYTSIANKRYPGSDYFDLNYMESLRKQKQYERLLDQYSDLFTRGYRTQENLYSYVHDIFCCIYDKNDSITIKEPLKQALTAELTGYIQKYPADLNAKLLFAKYLINQSAEIQTDFLAQKGRSAQLPGQYRKKILNNLNMSNKYLQEIVNAKIDSPEKTNPLYKESIALLKANQKYISAK